MTRSQQKMREPAASVRRRRRLREAVVADVVLLGTVILILFIVGFSAGVLIVVGVLGRRRGRWGGGPGAGGD